MPEWETIMLCLDKVNVYYGEIHALKDVSLQVSEGSVAALCGCAGSGRSTCLKAIAGAVRPKTGTISFRGRDITGLPAESPAIVQVPEGRRIFANMTVLENLQVAAPRPEKCAEQIEIVLGVFPLLRRKESLLAGSLSGEAQQMLIIGRALLAAPSLLLLDEPTHGLRPDQAETVMRCIPAINALGVTILLAEQNMALALAAADRCYIFAGGQIEREATGELNAGLTVPEVCDGF
ncbi:MAG: ATP-binding cassette domain-containing protein [Gracilibacteraceae bacterium]|jgi:branched-chain amino acid transport system ATP-binding protein|nr:ATP-binding cassette domain-containing protein [Gracilibacteraceae bacterium]